MSTTNSHFDPDQTRSADGMFSAEAADATASAHKATAEAYTVHTAETHERAARLHRVAALRHVEPGLHGSRRVGKENPQSGRRVFGAALPDNEDERMETGFQQPAGDTKGQDGLPAANGKAPDGKARTENTEDRWKVCSLMHSPFLPCSHVAPEPQSEGGSSSKIVVAPPKSRIQPLLREQWPLWARAIAKFRRPSDLGLGDTLVHLIGDARSDRFKKWFARKFGKSCGCTERQRWLNQRFPYGTA